MACSLIFSIPSLILPVREVMTYLPGPKCVWPDGPGVVLVCHQYREMALINERVVHGRQPQAHINLDTGTRPATFSLFLDVRDAQGIDLSDDEQVELMRMMMPDAIGMSNPPGSKLTRVIFGNHVDVPTEQLQVL